MNGMTATCFTTYSIQVSLVDEYAYRRPGRVLAYEVFAEFMAGGMGSSLTLWCDVAVDDGIGGGVGGGGGLFYDWARHYGLVNNAAGSYCACLYHSAIQY